MVIIEEIKNKYESLDDLGDHLAINSSHNPELKSFSCFPRNSTSHPEPHHRLLMLFSFVKPTTNLKLTNFVTFIGKLAR